MPHRRRQDHERERARRQPVEHVGRVGVRARRSRRTRPRRRRPRRRPRGGGSTRPGLRRRAGARPRRGRRPRGTRTTVTASTPPRIDVGLIQLDHGSPALPPAGTRPDAIAPATAPMQNGTITDEIAKIAPKTRRSDVRTSDLRNAKLEPRSTMPSAASESGTNSVSMIDANASGNAVQSTTRQKISQTWFASHTGPIEWSMSARGPLAPLRAAGDEVPEARAEVGAAEERVGGDPEEEHDRRRRRPRSPDPSRSSIGPRSARGPYGTSRRRHPASRSRRNRRLMRAARGSRSSPSAA